MNVVSIVGRLTKDVELRYTESAEPKAITKITVAVDRYGKKEEGKANADFINVIVFGKQAENLERFVGKGNRVGVQGKIRTGNYENGDGKRVYTTDVVADRIYFLEWKDRGDRLPEGFTELNEEDIPF